MNESEETEEIKKKHSPSTLTYCKDIIFDNKELSKTVSNK